MLQGGDNGPALVPGEPDKSRLIEAIRYTNVDLQMPREGQAAGRGYCRSDRVGEDGAAVARREARQEKTPIADFDLRKRKAEHWSWQPIRVPDVPKVKDDGLAAAAISTAFLLAKLEAKGLKPAADADPRTLIRRLVFRYHRAAADARRGGRVCESVGCGGR